MCSEKDDRVVSALKSINHPQTVRIVGQNGPPVARLFCKNRFEYLMRKTRVTVGRTSAKSAADVDMGSSTYISRNHLEIYTTESRFYVLVTGKNGVFIDGVFHRKGSAPFELQPVALLRFPSTDITIQFHVLLEEEPVTPIKYPLLPTMEDTAVVKKENNLSNMSYKPNSPVGKQLMTETPTLVPAIELKQEVVPASIKSEIVPKPRNREPVVKEPKIVAADEVGRDRMKPPYSYAQLIVQAISSQKDKQLTLSGIYAYITKKYPYYRSGDKGWQNSIRHNLSLNRYFIKVPRAQEESGKGSFWRIDPASEGMLTDQAFKRRRQRTTPGSKPNQGDTTPSLASMSSVEADGIGTPEDSCMSWEGGSAGIEETNELVIAEDVKPRPVVFQGNGTTYCNGQGNQNYEEPIHHVPASYAHHALPQLVTKPQIFIAKPSGISGSLNHIQGVVPVQLPMTMATGTASNVTTRPNDLELKDSVAENKVFMIPEKPASFMGYMQRPPQSFHPKTVIVRMNSNSAMPTATPVGGQLVRFAFGLPASDTQNLVSAVKVKGECEEMDCEESPSANLTSYVSRDFALEPNSGDPSAIHLQTVSN